jgi:peptidoglycan/xylan/chitin deacetylase (PgdA/CDA1 family)
VKSVLRDAVAELAFAARVTRPDRAGAGRLNIATFHHVLPAEIRSTHPLPGLVVTPEELSWFLALFKRHYTCGSLVEVAARWLQDEKPARPFLALTFDDTPRDSFTHALPALERAEVRATFFAPAASVEASQPLWQDRLCFAVHRILLDERSQADRFLERLGISRHPDEDPLGTAGRVVAHAKSLVPQDREDCLAQAEKMAAPGYLPEWVSLATWEELAALAKAGHEIGSHSMTHPLLSQCSDAEIEHEVRASRQLLQQRLGVPVDSFCYPNGDFDERVLQAVREAGYRFAVATKWGPNAPGACLFQLSRCDMHPDHARDRRGRLSERRVALRMSGLQPGLR